VGKRGVRIAAVGACVMLAAGCAVAPGAPPLDESVRVGRATRERQLNDAWQNHSLRELVDTLGPPRQLLDIPGGGNPPGFVAVYGRDPGSGCVDAFAVMYGAVTRVRLYLCR